MTNALSKFAAKNLGLAAKNLVFAAKNLVFAARFNYKPGGGCPKGGQNLYVVSKNPMPMPNPQTSKHHLQGAGGISQGAGLRG